MRTYYRYIINTRARDAKSQGISSHGNDLVLLNILTSGPDSYELQLYNFKS